MYVVHVCIIVVELQCAILLIIVMAFCCYHDTLPLSPLPLLLPPSLPLFLPPSLKYT